MTTPKNGSPSPAELHAHAGISVRPELRARAEALLFLIETVHRLRAPGGCPWDREQTHQSLRKFMMEEAFEAIDVMDRIDSSEKLMSDATLKGLFREELGDVLMQVVLHSELTREIGAFDIFDVADALADKLIRRHPHVFGETKAVDAEAALSSWEKQKAREKEKDADASVLDGVPRGMPALQRSARVLEKVTKVGFQWPDMEGPFAKLREELAEFETEIRGLERMPKDGPAREGLRRKAEAELGDLLFTLGNVAHLMKLNPEDALRTTLHRFESRFRHVERRLKENGKLPEHSTLEEMDRYWDEAKARERSAGEKT